MPKVLVNWYSRSLIFGTLITEIDKIFNYHDIYEKFPELKYYNHNKQGLVICFDYQELFLDLVIPINKDFLILFR